MAFASASVLSRLSTLQTQNVCAQYLNASPAARPVDEERTVDQIGRSRFHRGWPRSAAASTGPSRNSFCPQHSVVVQREQILRLILVVQTAGIHDVSGSSRSLISMLNLGERALHDLPGPHGVGQLSFEPFLIVGPCVGDKLVTQSSGSACS